MHITSSHPAYMAHAAFFSCAARHDAKAFKLGTPDSTMDTDEFYVGDLASEVLELLPVEHPVLLSPPSARHYPLQTSGTDPHKMHLVVAPPPSWVAPRHHAKVASSKPSAKKRRRRDRKRTDKQKKLENAKRKAKQDVSKARRAQCLKQERTLRHHVRALVHAHAAFFGVKVDYALIPMLPVELQRIMARADAAMLAYRNFSGQATLSKELNQLPSWWW